MRIFTLYRELELPISIEEAWAFFSSPRNLAKITPPELGFEILSDLGDGPIYSGMEIEYMVKPLLGIPLKWITEITSVDAPFVFTDKQLKGPYKLWEHTHFFTAIAGGVRMRDEVKYGLPLGPLGIIAHSLVVRNKLNAIFNFREQVLTKLFGQKQNQ